MILNAVDKTGLKTIKNDFSSNNNNLYCRVTHFIDDAQFEKFKAEVDQKFGQLVKIEVT